VMIFTVRVGTIAEMVEFWLEPFPAPDNRKHLVEKIDS